jgi:hypothetical protein
VKGMVLACLIHVGEKHLTPDEYSEPSVETVRQEAVRLFKGVRRNKLHG